MVVMFTLICGDRVDVVVADTHVCFGDSCVLILLLCGSSCVCACVCTFFVSSYSSSLAIRCVTSLVTRVLTVPP